MMTMPTQQVPTAKQRRAVASRYFVGLGLIAAGAVLEHTFHFWNRINDLPNTATLSDALLPLSGLLLPFLLGGVLAAQSTALLVQNESELEDEQ